MIPSILNDVLGPIMRGPSSSHTAAAARIGQLARCMITPKTSEIIISFGQNSSLAFTYHTQCSDMGFASGLLNIPLSDARAVDSLALAEKFIPLRFMVDGRVDVHPSTYRVSIYNDKKTSHFQAISTGGGMIEVVQYNGVPISLFGDRYTYLLMFPKKNVNSIDDFPNTTTQIFKGTDQNVLALSSANPFPEELLCKMYQFAPKEQWVYFPLLLPLPMPDCFMLPFDDYESLMKCIQSNPQTPLWRHALDYECARGQVDELKMLSSLDQVLVIMENAVLAGRKQIEYSDRILHSQAYKLIEAQKENKLLGGMSINNIIANVSAVMECKSAMQPIVAAPTAGSCGCLPGALLGVRESTREEKLHALLAAGIVGVLFCKQATFAAEVAGCQVECGAASGLTAAALTQLAGGTAMQCLDAASMAIQGLTGLACDPVAGRVEVPCLGKNIAAAANALCCANMALSGFNAVIPLNETIDAVMKIGQMLPESLRCTLGGLGCTPTSIELNKTINN